MASCTALQQQVLLRITGVNTLRDLSGENAGVGRNILRELQTAERARSPLSTLQTRPALSVSRNEIASLQLDYGRGPDYSEITTFYRKFQRCR